MIWPFQTLRYETLLSVDEAIAKLGGNVGRAPKWLGQPPPERYVGDVADRTFSIRHNIRGRGSSLILLRGVIRGAAQGTELEVRFDIHPAIIAFSLLWLGTAAYLLPASIAVPAIVFCFFILIFAFCDQAIRAERDLKEMIPPLSSTAAEAKLET